MDTDTRQVNINTATAEELAGLSGIEPEQAEAIVAHRDAHGLFETAADLVDVEGIGDTIYDIFLEGRVMAGPTEAPETAPEAKAPEEPEETTTTPPVEEAPSGEEPEEAPSIAEDRPPFTPPPPPVTETDRDGCAATVIEWLVLLFLGALLATALSLGILYARNGTLNFSEVRGVREARAAIVELQSQQAQVQANVKALEQQADRLSRTLASLEEKANTLETYTGTIRNELETAKGDIETARGDLATTREDVETLQADVKAVATESAQFDGFLTQLRDVLIEFQGTPLPTATPTATPTYTPTASPTVTGTATARPTATAGQTPTAQPAATEAPTTTPAP
ncbi:MAG: ComE operon protein 1 [Anaerolineales bacterium]|nr:ComE operon protein 1 [Anaerolineales bacterium]